MYFHSIRLGDSFKFTGEEFLKTFPNSKDKVYILSEYKYQSKMFYILVNSEGGCKRFRLKNLPEVEKVEAEKVTTLAMFGRDGYFIDYCDRPKTVKLNVNGEVGVYEILPEFWNENFSNIHVRGLKRWGMKYSIPGSAIVMK